MSSNCLNQKQSKIDLEKYNRNLDVLDYLNNNPKISKVSLFDIIKKMKYVELLKSFFLSKEFEDSIIELIDKNEKIEYIEKYINLALNYVNFYLSIGVYKPNSDDHECDIAIIIDQNDNNDYKDSYVLNSYNTDNKSKSNKK